MDVFMCQDASFCSEYCMRQSDSTRTNQRHAAMLPVDSSSLPLSVIHEATSPLRWIVGSALEFFGDWSDSDATPAPPVSAEPPRPPKQVPQQLPAALRRFPSRKSVADFAQHAGSGPQDAKAEHAIDKISLESLLMGEVMLE